VVRSFIVWQKASARVGAAEDAEALSKPLLAAEMPRAASGDAATIRTCVPEVHTGALVRQNFHTVVCGIMHARRMHDETSAYFCRIAPATN
jgi:hypothetical protein